MMDDMRRSAAAQFFMEDDNHDSHSWHQKVVRWINEASLSLDVHVRSDLLHKVQEVVLHKEPELLHGFLHEVIAFQHDRHTDIRKFVVGFIEEAFKKDWELLPKIIGNIQVLLQDNAPQVQKRVVQAVTQLYRIALMWVSRASVVTDQMQSVWNILTNIKAYIINMVDSENDGLRTQIVKFLETLVILQTYPEAESIKRENDFSLEDVPLTLKIARRRKLEEEAMTVFDLMIKFHGSAHISSANLMACMGSLTTIAKLRPQFMGKVVTALETLHINLPPTLSTSQVNSVRKHLKMQLLNLLRHPTAMDYNTNITTLLTDLGASNHEVMKAFPKSEDIKKRIKRSVADSGGASLKKQRMEDQVVTKSAVDITEAFINERLTPELAANLVIVAMNRLPDVMPPLFSATYTPIAAAGTQGQINHVARLLATQLNAAGLGPGAIVASRKPIVASAADDDDDADDDEPVLKMSSLALGGFSDETTNVEDDPSTSLSSSATNKTPHSKNIKLHEMAKPLMPETRENLEVSAVRRILDAEASALSGGVSEVRTKLLAILAASFNPRVRQTVYNYIIGDLRNQIGLALTWLYEEYSLLQGFNKRPPNQLQEGVRCDHNYSSLLCKLINSVIEHTEMKDRDVILTRLYLEVPVLTDEATELIKHFSATEVLGLNIVHKLSLMRPPKQLLFLNTLLANTCHQNNEIRDAAIDHIVRLYERDEMHSIIEEYAVLYLKFLCLSQPPDVLFGQDKGRLFKQENWNDDGIKACLYLYVALLPINQELVHELARVYIQTVADVKRTILRVIETPIKLMGMDSPQLLKLVEECPKGSETLVTRIIHILTDRSAPSVELVARVRELYHTRVSDVRFLIPVLNGLSKNEVIAALPKLIKLNPIVVKEVFNRLLGTQTEMSVHSSPITPSELLIALHTIDPSKCELKTVIKATSLCFADKQAYTQEVLAVVMQHLMEVTPLPTLLMRTVIQALSLYPRLIGFVMNILQRLILKQVWRQKKVWEGFIKCCQRTQPHSFQVLLQLPAPQLADVFTESPDLKQPLLDHIMGFTENQRAHIPQSVMDILLGPSHPVKMEFDIKEEPVSPPDLTIDVRDDPEEIPKFLNEPAPPGME